MPYDEHSLYMHYISTNKTRWKLYRIIWGWTEKALLYHRKSLQSQCYQSETILSSYVWETKRAIDQIPSLKWSIITVRPAYSNITKLCQLCLHKKYAIITYPDPENLWNKRFKITSKYPYKRKFLLGNDDTHDQDLDLINFIN